MALLTITLRGEHAQDLSYLLYKNPSKIQKFKVNNMINAYVFYPILKEDICTCALLLDINSLDLVKGKEGTDRKNYYTLFDYINDRPYVASSFLSTAIINIFRTAMSGKCDDKPDIVDKELDLEARICTLPVNKINNDYINKIFEPLGYTVNYSKSLLDNEYPEWGESNYIDLIIRGNVKLCDLLSQLYILIPVFDKSKHYHTSEKDIQKILNVGESWLKNHPYKNKIINRYFDSCKDIATQAIDILTDENDQEIIKEKKVGLNELRLYVVSNFIIEHKCKSVLDLGCGEGKLIKKVIESVEKYVAVDVSLSTIDRLKNNIKYMKLDDKDKEKLSIINASAIYKNDEFKDFDIICAIEIIEHLDKWQLEYFIINIFKYAKPKYVIISTPNIEYNPIYNIEEGKLRYFDHKFEFTRNQFKEWCENIKNKYNYDIQVNEIGDFNEKFGCPTQICFFTRNDK